MSDFSRVETGVRIMICSACFRISMPRTGAEYVLLSACSGAATVFCGAVSVWQSFRVVWVCAADASVIL